MLLTWSVSNTRSSFYCSLFSDLKHRKNNERIINFKTTEKSKQNQVFINLCGRFLPDHGINRVIVITIHTPSTEDVSHDQVEWERNEEECPGHSRSFLLHFTVYCSPFQPGVFLIYILRRRFSPSLNGPSLLRCFTACNEICIVSSLFFVIPSISGKIRKRNIGEVKQRITRVEFITPWGSIAMPSASKITIHDDDLLRSELLFYHSKREREKSQREEQKRSNCSK